MSFTAAVTRAATATFDDLEGDVVLLLPTELSLHHHSTNVTDLAPQAFATPLPLQQYKDADGVAVRYTEIKMISRFR